MACDLNEYERQSALTENQPLYAAALNAEFNAIQAAIAGIVACLQQGSGPATPTGLTPPSGLAARNNSTCSSSAPIYSVVLSWTPGDLGAETRVLRNGAVVYTAPAGSAGWTDSAPPIGEVLYGVQHVKPGAASEIVSQGVTIANPCTTPTLPAPSGFTATNQSACAAGSPSYRVRLAWTAGDASAQTKITRGGVLVATVEPGVASYDDVQVTPGTHTYQVQHVKGSQASDPVAATPLLVENPCPSELGAPRSLSGSDRSVCAVDGETPEYLVMLNWTNTRSDADVRILENGRHVLTLPAGYPASVNIEPAGPGTYTYELRYAKDGALGNPVSTQVVVTNPCGAVGEMKPPYNLTGTLLEVPGSATRSARLAWTNGDSSKRTNVYRSGALLVTMPFGANSFNDETLGEQPVSYYLKHLSDDGLSESHASNELRFAALVPPT